MTIRKESRREHLRILALRAPFAFTEVELMIQHLEAVGQDTAAIRHWLACAKDVFLRRAGYALRDVPADTAEQEAGRDAILAHAAGEKPGP